jgi:hypothetical protein
MSSRRHSESHPLMLSICWRLSVKETSCLRQSRLLMAQQ